jgi:hypothetical protein
MVELIISIVVWIVAMELNASQDVIWSSPRLLKQQIDALHVLDGFQIAAIGIALAYSYKGASLESFILGVFFFFARCGYFSWRMNMKRKRKGTKISWYHLGQNWWDKLFHGSPKLYFIVCFLGMPSCIIWLSKEYINV